MYAVVASIIRRNKGVWQERRDIPTFYLNENMQGITSEDHARDIAQDILNPFGDKNVECFITIVEV